MFPALWSSWRLHRDVDEFLEKYDDRAIEERITRIGHERQLPLLLCAHFSKHMSTLGDDDDIPSEQSALLMRQRRGDASDTLKSQHCALATTFNDPLSDINIFRHIFAFQENRTLDRFRMLSRRQQCAVSLYNALPSHYALWSCWLQSSCVCCGVTCPCCAGLPSRNQWQRRIRGYRSEWLSYLQHNQDIWMSPADAKTCFTELTPVLESKAPPLRLLLQSASCLCAPSVSLHDESSSLVPALLEHLEQSHTTDVALRIALVGAAARCGDRPSVLSSVLFSLFDILKADTDALAVRIAAVDALSSLCHPSSRCFAEARTNCYILLNHSELDRSMAFEASLRDRITDLVALCQQSGIQRRAPRNSSASGVRAHSWMSWSSAASDTKVPEPSQLADDASDAGDSDLDVGETSSLISHSLDAERLRWQEEWREQLDQYQHQQEWHQHHRRRRDTERNRSRAVMTMAVDYGFATTDELFPSNV